MSIELLSTLPQHQRLGALREWLFSEENELSPESFIINGRALWMILMDLQQWDCVAELIKFKDVDISLNLRDRNGRGFCHYCIYQTAPDFLSIEGLNLLDGFWNLKDNLGNTPMECRPSVAFAQQMARRWWNEHQQLSPQQKCKHFQMLAQQIPDNDMYARPLKRTWLFWGRK